MNYRWVTELKPLPEEYYAQFPWNFKWNFNWLRPDTDLDNWPLYERDTQEQRDTFARLSGEHTNNFIQIMADKHFGGKVDAVVYYHMLHLNRHQPPQRERRKEPKISTLEH